MLRTVVGPKSLLNRNVAFVLAAVAMFCLGSRTCPPLAAQESTVVLTTVAGKKLAGQITSIEFEKINLQTDDQASVEIDYDQIDSVEFGGLAQLPLNSTRIQLLDGSELHAKELAIRSGSLQITLSCGNELSIDSRYISSVRFKTYENEPPLSKQWRTILDDQSRDGDALVINRSGELDTVDGIVGDLVDGKLTFSIEERTARVPLSRMDAILFYHASGQELGSPVCELTLVDQSIILARTLEWRNLRLRCVSVCGTAFEFSPELICSLDFSLGRNAFLSSFEPSTNDWQPLITSAAIFEQLRRMNLARVNESFSGQPLSLKFQPESGLSYLAKDKQFEHGFAIQGGGKLAFALNGQFERLTGLVGFDPAASSSGNVRFKVLLDGKTVMEKELVHREMNNPVEIDLSVKDVKRVVFEVDYNDGRSIGDRLHLVDLKVTH